MSEIPRKNLCQTAKNDLFIEQVICASLQFLNEVNCSALP